MSMNTFENKKVLVVDDEPVIRDVLEEAFAEMGAQVAKASSGNEALEHLKRGPFDLLISDVRMPDGDGVRLLKEINSQHLKVQKIFLFSGFSDITQEDAQNLGAIKIFAKPFSLNKLIAEISTHFE